MLFYLNNVINSTCEMDIYYVHVIVNLCVYFFLNKRMFSRTFAIKLFSTFFYCDWIDNIHLKECSALALNSPNPSHGASTLNAIKARLLVSAAFKYCRNEHVRDG